VKAGARTELIVSRIFNVAKYKAIGVANAAGVHSDAGMRLKIGCQAGALEKPPVITHLGTIIIHVNETAHRVIKMKVQRAAGLR